MKSKAVRERVVYHLVDTLGNLGIVKETTVMIFWMRQYNANIKLKL